MTLAIPSRWLLALLAKTQQHQSHSLVAFFPVSNQHFRGKPTGKDLFESPEFGEESAASWPTRTRGLPPAEKGIGLGARLARPPFAGSRSRTAFYLSIVAFALFLPNGLHLPYFPVWLAARGFSESEIAAALGLPTLVRAVAMPVAAAIADKRGIAETLAACCVAALAGYGFLAFAKGFMPVFAGAVFVIIALGAMAPLADALVLAGIRHVEHLGRGRIAYGGIRAWTSFGVLGTMLASGWIASAFPGERLIFALAGLTLAPVLAAIFAAAKFRHLRPRGSVKGTLTHGQLRRATAFIGAAALIQASHAEYYSFATLHWKAIGLTPGFIGAIWAMGVASESVLFLFAARYFGPEKNAAYFLVLGAVGAIFRWLAMSSDPSEPLLLLVGAMHGLSFGATYFGSVLLLGAMARETHRARMQGWLASASALSLALATFACGRLTSLFAEKAYLAMAALAALGLVFALCAAAMRRQ